MGGLRTIFLALLGCLWLAGGGGCTKPNPAATPCQTGADCSGDSPICDATAGTCRVCVSDGDCLAQGTGFGACAPDGTCVECIDANDCDDGACVNQRCVAGCRSNDECGGDEPVCDVGAGDCVGCLESEDCTTSEAPLCDEAINTCVECLESSQCDDGRLVCTDGACGACTDDDQCTVGARDTCDDGLCVECTAHGDCASGACDYDTGLCFPETAVVYAGGDGANRDASCGSRETPCSHLNDAAAKTTSERFVIRLLGNLRTDATIGIDGRELRVVSPRRWILDQVGGFSPVFEVVSRGALRMEGVELASAGDTLVSCSAARFELANGVFLSDREEGIDASECELRIERSIIGIFDVLDDGSRPAVLATASNLFVQQSEFTITGSPSSSGVLLDVDESGFQVRNNLFRGLGPFSITLSGRAGSVGDTVFEFNTLESEMQTVASPIVCAADTIVRNSIVARPPGAEPLLCGVAHSLVQGGAPGVGVIDADPAFVEDGSLRLTAKSPAIDAAQESPSVTTDFAGSPRPIGEGFDMGAFEFQP